MTQRTGPKEILCIFKGVTTCLSSDQKIKDGIIVVYAELHPEYVPMCAPGVTPYLHPASLCVDRFDHQGFVNSQHGMSWSLQDTLSFRKQYGHKEVSWSELNRYAQTNIQDYIKENNYHRSKVSNHEFHIIDKQTNPKRIPLEEYEKTLMTLTNNYLANKKRVQKEIEECA